MGNGTGTTRPVAGNTYGSVDLLHPTVPDAIDPQTFIDIPLNLNAINDINSSHNHQLSFFGDLSIPDSSTGVQEWFAFDGAIGEGGRGPIAQLVVATVPEPAGIVLLGTALILCAFLTVRSKRRRDGES
jgi:hypothetical protein